MTGNRKLFATFFYMFAFAGGRVSGLISNRPSDALPYASWQKRVPRNGWREYHREVATTSSARIKLHGPLRTYSSQVFMVDPSTTESVMMSSRYLVRIIFLRAMAFVHGIAFLIALHQNKALIGDGGITPAKVVLDKAEARGRQKRERRQAMKNQRGTHLKQVILASRSLQKNNILRAVENNRALGLFRAYWEKLREVIWDRSDAMNRPLISLLWLAKDRSKINPWLDGVAIAGLSLSLIIMLLGAANVPMVFGLWLCQRSIMSIGGPFYGFGWEPQLNELAFHTLFLVPLFSIQKIPHLPVSDVVTWTIRWMLFRIMIGAGLIKFRSGDVKWKNGTTMMYFYETQPIPNPLSRYFHWMPQAWHKLEVYTNHFVEIIVPWLLIIPGLPSQWQRAAGIIQIAFQAVLITSGNLSFLNWLTIVPALMCFDDCFVGRYFSPSMRTRAMGAAWTYQSSLGRRLVDLGFVSLVVWLSLPVVRNLLSKNQVMNGSFDPMRLINTYGAFGTVNEEREEFIISAAADFNGPWKEYEFKVKPGDLTRRPRWITPYHYRLDWQMWIAASCRTVDRSPWLLSLLLKLLQQQKLILRLLAKDPWEGLAEKPKYIRVDRFRYRYHRPTGLRDGTIWDREYLGRVYPRQGVATIEGIEDDILRLHAQH